MPLKRPKKKKKEKKKHHFNFHFSVSKDKCYFYIYWPCFKECDHKTKINWGGSFLFKLILEQVNMGGGVGGTCILDLPSLHSHIKVFCDNRT